MQLLKNEYEINISGNFRNLSGPIIGTECNRGLKIKRRREGGSPFFFPLLLFFQFRQREFRNGVHHGPLRSSIDGLMVVRTLPRGQPLDPRLLKSPLINFPWNSPQERTASIVFRRVVYALPPPLSSYYSPCAILLLVYGPFVHSVPVASSSVTRYCCYL